MSDDSIYPSRALEKKAVRYHQIKRSLYFVDLAVVLAIVVFWIRSNASSRIEGLLYGIPGLIGESVYFFAFFSALFLIRMPLLWYSNYVLERRFELSSRSLSSWWTDEVKGFFLSALFFVGTMDLFFLCVRIFPTNWWLAATAGSTVLSLALAVSFPYLILPIFFKMRRILYGELADRLRLLCERNGVRILEIYQLDLSSKTHRANAALAGLGRSRRILLGDTLISSFTPDEMEAVLAHELGHYAKGHVFKSFVSSQIEVLIGFGFVALVTPILLRLCHARSLTDLAVFPVLFLLGLTGGLIALPLDHALSRARETEADWYALSHGPSPEIFRNLMAKLGVQNLADPNPPTWAIWLFYDHPPIAERIKRTFL